MSAEIHLKRNIPPEHSYVILGRKRGEYRRGLELVTASMPPMPIAVSDKNARRKLFDAESGLPALEHNRALFLMDLGRLDEAEAILRGPVIRQTSEYYGGFWDKARYQFIARLNLCDLLLLRGRLSEAYAIADSLATALERDDVVSEYNETLAEICARVDRAKAPGIPFATGFNPYARRAVALMYQGNVPGALADFKRAEHYQQRVLDYYWLMNALSRVKACEKHGRSYKVDHDAFVDLFPHWPLLGQGTVYYGWLLTRLGKLHTAQRILTYTLRWANDWENHFPALAAFAATALSEVERLLGNYDAARHYLEAPLTWAAATQHQEVACWAHLSLARWAYARGDLTSAAEALTTARTLADTHGFTLYAIDCGLLAGRLAWQQRAFDTAVEQASRALTAAADPECRYAWAQASALHLLAEIYADPDSPFDKTRKLQAASLARAALELRARLQDARQANSQALVDRLAAQAEGA